MNKQGSRFNQRVCIVSPGYEGTVRTLTYGSRGLIRTYQPGALDPRCGEVVAVDSRETLLANLRDGKRCAVPVVLARGVFGWPAKDFSA